MELRAENIAFRYGRKEPRVLSNVNFFLCSGERVGILAPSGYGKSTLAMILAGLYTPESGRVLLDGNPIPGKGCCSVQLICQHPEQAVNPRWRMKRVLQEGGEIRREVLERFGIRQQWLGRFPGELSGGELQRFSLARAILAEPEFLICDEISTMLDTITQAQIFEALMEIAQERNLGLAIITHNRSLAERVCTRIVNLAE